MAVNRTVSSHLARVSLTKAGVPESAIVWHGRWYSRTMVSMYTRRLE